VTADVQGRAASAVDFETYGDYTGRPRIVEAAQTNGEFVRPRYRFQGRITADGSSGFRAERGRYHLYISWACPWATRAAIVRRLKGLESVVTLSAVDPVRDGRGWAFREGDGIELDPLNGFTLLSEAYDATEPAYDGHVSVPVLWDRVTKTIVSNNFPDITLDLDTAFDEWADPTHQLYPTELRPQIDELNDWIYSEVNNGVYRSGFATTQAAYEDAVVRIFTALDSLETRLGQSRYLFGDRITESDVRLWVTLVRFDAVYYSHFKANLRRIVDYPNLWGYARDLYQQPAFGESTYLDQIKRHYYVTHPNLNPTRIVPVGPYVDWHEPHGRG
jgi:glutathionyl-hydroquinone reductase